MRGNDQPAVPVKHNSVAGKVRSYRSSVSYLLVVILSAWLAAPGYAQVYDLLAGDPPALHHYPGADGRIGTSDDTVSHALTSIVGSDPNVHGAYSFAVFEAFFADPLLPFNSTAASFVHGSVELDPVVAAGGGGSLLVNATGIGTGFGQGLGVSTLEILAVNGGSYDPVTGALTLNADIEASAAGVTRQFTNAAVSGSAVLLDAADFGTGSGDLYVDSVLVPRAQALNAQGVVLIVLNGVAPLDPPWVIIPAPFTVVLAGLTGIPAGEQADLAVSKSVPSGPFSSGDQFVFALQVDNNGPATANAVIVSDPLPQGLAWISDTCGAGPPAGGLLSWNAGTLNAAVSTQCQVTVEVTATANFDQENGVTAFAAEFDPELTDNVAMAAVAIGQPGVAEGLAQAPDLATGFPSDRNCGSCPLGAQALADNFKVESQLQLGQIVFYGGYTDNQAFPDQFQLEIRQNLESSTMPGVPGVPGALLANISGAVSRSATGNLIAGFFEEYRYTASAALNLPRGSYWIVIHNQSSAGNDWFWESGNPDSDTRSLPTIAANNTIPPHPRWSPNPDFQLAVSLDAGGAMVPPGIPALQPAGLILLLLLLLATAWLGIGRRARHKSWRVATTGCRSAQAASDQS